MGDSPNFGSPRSYKVLSGPIKSYLTESLTGRGPADGRGVPGSSGDTILNCRELRMVSVRRECVCILAGESPAWEGSLAQ